MSLVPGTTFIHATAQRLRVEYTNYRDERSTRIIEPVRVYWGHTEYHIEDQWLMEAKDHSKEDGPVVRTFAMKDFHSVSVAS